MANIIKIINTAVEKGEVLIDSEGNTITPEKVKTILKKEYQNGLKNGSIDMESTSFKDYETERMKDYLTTNQLLGIFHPNPNNGEVEENKEVETLETE